jgi:glucokinase
VKAFRRGQRLDPKLSAEAGYDTDVPADQHPTPNPAPTPPAMASGPVPLVARAGHGPTADDLVLGLDIGGTKLAAGVVAGDGRVLSQLTIPARKLEGPDRMIARLVDLGREAVDVSGVEWSRIGSIGIACGGPLDPVNGIILTPPNLPGWDEIPLAKMVGDALDRRVAVDNDATAAAVAEWWYGAGRSRDVEDLIYLTISTGIGGGLILDGRPYRGVTGNAGELGHLTIDYHGRQCGCGRRGCLEAHASGTNIAVRAREALATGEASSLSGVEELTARDVAEAAAAGDPLATRIWDETMEMLASGVANILDAFNPDLVILGGGVTNAGDQLLRPVREQAFALAMPPMVAPAEIVLAELGSSLTVVGGAVVAFERFFDGRPESSIGSAARAAGAETGTLAPDAETSRAAAAHELP